MTKELRHRSRVLPCWRPLHCWLASAALLSAGCESILADGNQEGEKNERPPSVDNPDTDPGPVEIDDLDTVDPDTLPDGVAPASRFIRLGYSEYDRTVADLLHL